MDTPDFDAVLRARVVGEPPGADVEAAVRHLVEWGAGQVAALVFFGSRRSRARPDAHSAYDFFVVTRDDGAFYRALHAAGAVRRSPRLLAAAGRVLPPSQISLRPRCTAGATLHVKASVIALRRFLRETSPRRHDHFCVARLFQSITLLYAADDGLREQTLGALAAAHRATFEWVQPSLPSEFDAELYGRTLVEVSLGSEIRPEPAGRPRALWEAQREHLEPIYAALLDELCRAGRLRSVGEGRFTLARPVTPGERRRVRRYFRRSLVRATARWGKHVLTFEGWLDYIVHKAERHTGRPIVLTPRERRHPLVFLWPRVVRYLRERRSPGE